MLPNFRGFTAQLLSGTTLFCFNRNSSARKRRYCACATLGRDCIEMRCLTPLEKHVWRQLSTMEFIVDNFDYRFLSTKSTNRCSPTFKWDELLFGLTHSRTMDVRSRYLFGVLSVAARKAITKRWLKPDAPSLEDWYDMIYDIFVMEVITFSLKLQQSKFEAIWRDWKSYISLRRPSFV